MFVVGDMVKLSFQYKRILCRNASKFGASYVRDIIVSHRDDTGVVSRVFEEVGVVKLVWMSNCDCGNYMITDLVKA